MTVYTLAEYPVAAQGLSRGDWVSFAFFLTGFLWIALLPPPALVASRRAVRIGAFTGLTLVLVTSPTAWAIEALASKLADQISVAFVLLAVIGTFTTCAAKVTASERSFRAGVTAAFWAGIVAAMLGFSFDLLGTLRGLNFGAHLREYVSQSPVPDLSTFLTKHIGEHLDSAMVGLARLPMFALLLGLIGAAIGRRRRQARAGAAFVVP